MAQATSDESSIFYVSFVVPKFLVKQAKSNLERKHKLDRSVKIQPYRRDAYINACGDHMLIQSTIILPDSMSQLEGRLQALKELGLESYYDRIFIIKTHSRQASDVQQYDAQRNPLQEAFGKGLQQLPKELLASLCLTMDRLLADLPDSYTIYPPMLLLTSKTFASSSWQTLLASASPRQLNDLYATVATALRVTHIAQNAPIPPSIGQSLDRDPPASEQPLTKQPTTANILRSPTGLKPLYGSFGPLTKTAQPTPHDLTTALWVSTRQNNILQTWAPVHTMFSRGNISEKTRLLTLPSIAQAVAEGEVAGAGSTAVDLYAGIGYFAFCYARAGVRRVLCWELNGWSVEGLRRGAAANGWGVRVVEGDGQGMEREEVDGTEEGEVFWVWRESNERAGERIERLRGAVPPIRHVNCGLLPSSRGSWETAVGALDPGLGGWVHVHENIAMKEIEGKAAEILEEIQGIVDRVADEDHRSQRDELGGRKAILEHVQKVKTYAPGVMHCVLDIWIPPRRSLDEVKDSCKGSISLEREV
ncbi:hypothetical protein W97_00311 [Coniosporium apollinis CBS 100218]|uniref:tRNA(Phe) (4-demethylwyosine(37)-C(7)) aminocarboxypropyltransferase n=1 Tax=Coniosporium apollinis (strain CBS 100218) TaxID=1168221 RepID=R7YGT5_CONA1|nr:uncharacterized protein W97_00311 [Coniosporium apollinis CBS 100218]EON61100.1 hypothetical protein W97_00311 [Coniosporium apollinis CBS 100218]